MGLPKAHRLKNRQDYRAVYEKGIRRYSPHLTLIALQIESGSNHPTMVGISISKKVSKKAVIRNRIKRQIRAVIASKLEAMPSGECETSFSNRSVSDRSSCAIAPGWKVVIVVKPKAIECKYEHFLRELEELLKKAKIINGY